MPAHNSWGAIATFDQYPVRIFIIKINWSIETVQVMRFSSFNRVVQQHVSYRLVIDRLKKTE